MLREMRGGLAAGWKQGRWSTYFVLYLFPLVAAAAGLSFLIEGGLQTEPSALTWFLASVASLIAFWLAGLHDGSRGWLGGIIWTATLAIATVWAVYRATRNPDRPTTTRVGWAREAWEITVTAIPVESIRNREWRVSRHLVAGH